jgi:hypothetical protein
MMLDCERIVQLAALENVHDVAASDDDYRMPVLADLPVCLGIKVRCCHKDAKLAVPQTRDEAA